jgi:hypothetical protein
MKLATLLVIAMILLPAPAFATGSSVLQAHVKNLQISKGYGHFVFINIDVTSTGAPTCENSSWQYTLTLSNPGDSQMYELGDSRAATRGVHKHS